MSDREPQPWWNSLNIALALVAAMLFGAAGLRFLMEVW